MLTPIWATGRLARAGTHRERLALESLQDEVADHPPVVHVHTWPEGVEDPGHAHLHTLLQQREEVVRLGGSGRGAPLLGLCLQCPVGDASQESAFHSGGKRLPPITSRARQTPGRLQAPAKGQSRPDSTRGHCASQVAQQLRDSGRAGETRFCKFSTISISFPKWDLALNRLVEPFSEAVSCKFITGDVNVNEYLNW